MTDDPNDSPTSWPRYKKMALWVPASAHCGCSAIGLGANESKRIALAFDCFLVDPSGAMERAGDLSRVQDGGALVGSD